jgi:hypothetical protein
VLVCLARKSSATCCVLSHAVVGTWTYSCWRTVHSPSTVANSHFTCVFAILVSSSRVDSLDSVCGGCEFESVLVLYPF